MVVRAPLRVRSGAPAADVAPAKAAAFEAVGPAPLPETAPEVAGPAPVARCPASAAGDAELVLPLSQTKITKPVWPAPPTHAACILLAAASTPDEAQTTADTIRIAITSD